MERQFNIKFLRVEDLAREVRRGREIADEAYVEEVFQVIEKGVRHFAGLHSQMVFESTGITRHFDHMLDSLRTEHRVVTIKVLANRVRCLDRVRTRDRSIHIDVSDAQVENINAQVEAKGMPTDFSLDNDDRTADELTKKLSVIIKAANGHRQ